jgi:hypothetical protein
MPGEQPQKKGDADRFRAHGYEKLSWAIQVMPENSPRGQEHGGLGAQNNRIYL